MTKKHFEALARRFKEARPIIPDMVTQWALDVQLVTDVCAADNSRFDRIRFLKACGVLS